MQDELLGRTQGQDDAAARAAEFNADVLFRQGETAQVGASFRLGFAVLVGGRRGRHSGTRTHGEASGVRMVDVATWALCLTVHAETLSRPHSLSLSLSTHTHSHTHIAHAGAGNAYS
jgi:hypothetical protein